MSGLVRFQESVDGFFMPSASVLAGDDISCLCVVCGGVGCTVTLAAVGDLDAGAPPGTSSLGGVGAAASGVSSALQGGVAGPSLFWWWRRPLTCGVGGDASAQRLEPDAAVADAVLGLTVSKAKRELARVYAMYDAARAALMWADAVAAGTCPLVGRRDGAGHVVLIPLEEDWAEAVRRGLPLVVVLRFTLWAYALRGCRRHGGGTADMQTALPLPQFVPGVHTDRGDWLEMLALFAPPDYAAALLQRARSISGSRDSADVSCKESLFLSWRRTGPLLPAAACSAAAAEDAAAAATAASGVAWTNSARHGAVHLRATLRPPPTPTQVFLFHGEWHVLHHLEGVVRCTSEVLVTAAETARSTSGEGGVESRGSPLATLSPIASRVGAAVEDRGDAPPTAAQSRAVGGGTAATAAWRHEGVRQRCVERGMLCGGGGRHAEAGDTDSNNDSDDVGAIVDYAEALLLPVISAQAANMHASVPCGSRGYVRGAIHDDTSDEKSGGCEGNGATTTAAANVVHGGLTQLSTFVGIPREGAAATAALPEALTAVGGGAFCLPRSVVQSEEAFRVLASWGFVPAAMAASVPLWGGSEASAYDVVSRSLPLSAFTARFCGDILQRRGVPASPPSSAYIDDDGSSCWWPLGAPSDGSGDDATSDEDDDVSGLALRQLGVLGSAAPHPTAAPLPRPLA
ncbi:hypothetical protein TraAM80_05255 [Trypanosoma rangeli]|uniref:Uncharacterized protein n=1 Tax=Trypanosoma rangeli TaxID=5698 RepID=A0A3R7KDJ7_TRYRA|nr:uncharacterized protein TraAM80_05255 [Trypanosoma rangeli]RNF04376.1 hypothetical protein TraAM80_05255 [Trypanosoma rangeli]|eukprot:RNF04376.1 hypothetical protein TraAM80_05255 [Trypanosoma rangeli]